MSFEELERTWTEQPQRAVDRAGAMRHLAKLRRSTAGATAFAVVGLLLALGNLALKVHRLVDDERFTLANASWDLVIGVTVVVGSGVGLWQAVRLRREFRALASDTFGCLELLIRQVRGEIRSFRRDLPLVLGGIAVLLVLAKAQSIAAGIESSSEWLLVGLVVAAMVMAVALMQHRVTAFLVPRLGALEAVRRDLAEGP